METQKVSEETRRQLADATQYDEGGHLPPNLTVVRNDTGEPIPVYTPIQLSRGSVLMSQASFEALTPDMRNQLFAEQDVILAEHVLAELDSDED